MTEAILWAMIIFVADFNSLRNAARILASVAVSTALVESSKIKIFGFVRIARAIQSRCFCPPDTFTPPCPSSVFNPSGICFKNSSAQAARHAAWISSSEASGFPHNKFSRIVPEKSVFFCKTMLTAPRKISIG